MVVRLSTNEGRKCPLCDYYLDGDKFEEACNHLSESHGLKRLHVGQETLTSSSGQPWQSTVAVFGN